MDWITWRRHTPAWLGLRTRDAFDAAIFYGEVLDWATDRPGSCQVEYEKARKSSCAVTDIRWPD